MNGTIILKTIKNITKMTNLIIFGITMLAILPFAVEGFRIYFSK